MVQYFDIGGCVVRVTGADDEMPADFGRLTPFIVPPQPFGHEIDLRVAERLDEPAGECVYADGGRRVYDENGARVSYVGSVGLSLDGAYLRISRRGASSQVQVKRSGLCGRITSKLILSAAEPEHLIVSRGGFLLHASCIGYGGQAILFTAPSGTGKSTQAELWRVLRGAQIINGDRCVVRAGEQGVQALGIPYSGSSGISKNCRLPLRAIVYLGQAPRTEIYRLRGYRAFARVWEGVSVNTWDKADVEQASAAVQQTVQAVPVFYLPCTPDETAVAALEQALESR